MADEFNSSTNWWDSSNSSRNRFDTGSNNNNNNNPSSNSSSSSGLSNTLGSFSWPTAELMVDHVKPRSSNSNSVADSGPADLHLMGLGLSSQAIDHWNQSLFRTGEKSDGSNFRLMESYQQQQEPSSSSPSSQVHQWRERVMGFSLDHQQFSPHGSSTDSTVTCQGLQSNSNFQQMDNNNNISPSIYACGSPATLFQGLVLASSGSPSDQQNQGYNPYGQNYDQFLPPSSSSSSSPSWSNKVPNKQQPPHQQLPNNHLHFSNNAPFWNASASSNINDVRPSYFQPLQPQFPTSSFDEKPKNISDVRDSNTVVKKSGSEGGGGGGGASTAKRPRNEAPSTLPAFKVRKEKMGDRITALQQLVSPFGKTDTASVLSEAIEYIKFLHEQVSVLSTPYMKSGAAIHHQHHQSSDHKSKDGEGQKQDLRSRGLCLVPVSSTFPVTHETTMDIWTPTYGGTFR